MDYRLGYFTLDVIILIFWLIFFIYRKNLRKEMIIMSLLTTPFGPLSEYFYLKDYWHPGSIIISNPIIEDLLFAFLIGGIGAIIYEEISSKYLVNRHLQKHYHILTILISTLILGMILFNKILGINSIYATFISFLIIYLIIVFIRHDLVIPGFLNGLFLGISSLVYYFILLQFFPEIFQKFWYLNNISGLFIWKVPIEEVLWFFNWGLVSGLLYEFITGMALRKMPNKLQ